MLVVTKFLLFFIVFVYTLINIQLSQSEKMNDYLKRLAKLISEDGGPIDQEKRQAKFEEIKKKHKSLQNGNANVLKDLKELLPNKNDVCVVGIMFYSPTIIEDRVSRFSEHKCLLRYGFLTFADSCGPTIFAISNSDGKVYEFWQGNISDKDNEKYVYIGLEQAELNAENIQKSRKRVWDNIECFAKDALAEKID